MIATVHPKLYARDRAFDSPTMQKIYNFFQAFWNGEEEKESPKGTKEDFSSLFATRPKGLFTGENPMQYFVKRADQAVQGFGQMHDTIEAAIQDGKAQVLPGTVMEVYEVRRMGTIVVPAPVYELEPVPERPIQPAQGPGATALQEPTIAPAPAPAPNLSPSIAPNA